MHVQDNAMGKNIITIAIFAMLAVIFGTRCASIGSIQGGPKDSLPPVIVKMTPLPYSTNFNGKKVSIEFNEYVQLKEQQKNFFMSPAAQEKPLLTVKGRAIEVQFQSPLDSATTYRLDFGSSIRDNNEGNALTGYSFVFSTGDYIDSLMMAGQVINAFERDSVVDAFLFYFDAKADSMKLDSTMFLARAEALFRSDSSGYFFADILKEKPYRIYAIRDENGNQQYESGTDYIGFLDSIYNPTELEGFTLNFDSLTRKMQLDRPQVKLELFMEKPVKRQLLGSQERPMAQKIMMTFSAAQARIDSLELQGVPREWLIEDRNKAGDTLIYWINPGTEENLKALSDTIVGSMIYYRTDSLWQLEPRREKLRFTYKRPAPPKVDKRDTTEKKEVNPFKFTVEASSTLNPESGINFLFDYPLLTMDSAKIELMLIDKKVETLRDPVKVRMEQDSTNIRRWKMKAPWIEGRKYDLLIPSGVFTNIAMQKNDSLQSEFTVDQVNKHGTFVFETAAEPGDSTVYIFELYKPEPAKRSSSSSSASGSKGQSQGPPIVYRVKDVRAGQTLKMRFIPQGNYRLRIIEDRNGNGEWDTGSLTIRQHPEKVRTWQSETTGLPVLTSKENWEIVEKFKLSELFAK